MLTLKTVPADHLPGGFSDFRVREDFVDSYRRVLARARALGGVVTSSGGLRDLHEPATAGRSRTSLHYTGRAIDLYIESGMRSVRDPYAIVPEVDGSITRWTILCESVSPKTDDALYDASLVRQRTVSCAIWKAGVGYTLVDRAGRFFSLTDLFVAEGWKPIPARSDWKNTYLSCEWWHFQNQTGLRSGVSTFGDELRQIWPAALVAASGLALAAVWSSQSFKAGTPAQPALPVPTGDEKVAWIQQTLNSSLGTALDTDGKPGAKTTTALRRFQTANALAVSGICDEATETALVQRGLEALGNTPFPNIGVRDAATTDSLKQFQRVAGLHDDGTMGPKTRAAMVERLSQRPAMAAGIRAALATRAGRARTPRSRRA